MKTLLSLPPNLVDCFHQIEKVSEDAWFCTSDPVGARLGSGGGTTWLLESCWQKEHKDIDFKSWLALEKRILLHAGGQSRRLPSYAPSGKILTPNLWLADSRPFFELPTPFLCAIILFFSFIINKFL